MRSFLPDSQDYTGGNASQQSVDTRSVDTVPSGMDNDPQADEEVIDQQESSAPPQQYPEPVQAPSEPAKLAPDNLAESIAYALDGSGPGPMNEQPNVSGHKVITEGTTGASLDEEEDALRND